jgi:hypothetical protein
VGIPVHREGADYIPRLPLRLFGPVGIAVGQALVSANDPTGTFVRFV